MKKKMILCDHCEKPLDLSSPNSIRLLAYNDPDKDITPPLPHLTIILGRKEFTTGLAMPDSPPQPELDLCNISCLMAMILPPTNRADSADEGCGG